jgi:hypothetical protein
MLKSHLTPFQRKIPIVLLILEGVYINTVGHTGHCRFVFTAYSPHSHCLISGYTLPTHGIQITACILDAYPTATLQVI